MRVKGMFRPSDLPADAGEAASGAVKELFDYLCPGNPEPSIDMTHAGLAITGRNPSLALHLAKLSRCIAVDSGWCQRQDLRELAIQTLNVHFKSDYSFQARLPYARAVGISDDQLAELSLWRSSALFSPEQRLVIEYTNAVVTGEIPDELFARVVDIYGETGAIEFTALVGTWSSWAMIINAARPECGSLAA